MKNKYEAKYLECTSNKYTLTMLTNQNKALNKALEAERTKYHTLVKSNKGLKERYKICTDHNIKLSKEIATLHKNKLDNVAMQCKLDFAKREYESVSEKYNAGEQKAKATYDDHLRNISDTCKQEVASSNKMGYLHAQSKLKEHRNHSIKTFS